MAQIWQQGRPTRRQLAFDLCAGLGYAVLVGLLYATVDGWHVLVVIVLAAALAVRRLSLPLMVGFGLVAAVAQFANPGWHLDLAVADVAYAAIFFVLGAHPKLAIRRFGVLAGTVGCGALLVWIPAFADRGVDTKTTLFGTVASTAMAALVCGGGWVSGFLRLQRRRAIQTALDAQVDEVERRRLAQSYEHELQRSKIAADMHDIVAHSWAVVAAQADGARYALRTNPDASEQALEVIAETARSTIADLRTILAELRDTDTEQSTPGHEQQQRLIERMRLTGMQIRHECIGAPDASTLLSLTAYRLLSESLTNALKHGDLTRPVHVRQDWTQGYRLRVVNRIGDRGDGTGHGVVGMMERASIAGGHLHAEARGQDWIVEASIPAPGRSSSTPATTTSKESAPT